MIEIPDRYLVHFDLADEYLTDAAGVGPGEQTPERSLAAAQVHATLALAVAADRIYHALAARD